MQPTFDWRALRSRLAFCRLHTIWTIQFSFAPVLDAQFSTLQMQQLWRGKLIDFLAWLFTVLLACPFLQPKTFSRASKKWGKQLCLHGLRTRNKFGNTAAMRSSKSFGSTFLAQFAASGYPCGLTLLGLSNAKNESAFLATNSLRSTEPILFPRRND